MKHAPSFPLVLGWVATFSVILPALLFIVAGAAFRNEVVRETLGPNGPGVWALAGFTFLLVRIPLFAYTALFDRNLVLGESSLRIPIVGAFRFRPWSIPWSRLVAVRQDRKSGGSRFFALVLDDGSERRFDATVLPSDRWDEAEKAIRARIEQRTARP